MNHRPTHLRTTRGQLLIHHDHIDRPADPADSIAQTHSLSDAILNTTLDHQEVQVAVPRQLTTRGGPKQDHPRLWRSLRQPPAGLSYDRVVKHAPDSSAAGTVRRSARQS